MNDNTMTYEQFVAERTRRAASIESLETTAVQAEADYDIASAKYFALPDDAAPEKRFELLEHYEASTTLYYSAFENVFTARAHLKALEDMFPSPDEERLAAANEPGHLGLPEEPTDAPLEQPLAEAFESPDIPPGIDARLPDEPIEEATTPSERERTLLTGDEEHRFTYGVDSSEPEQALPASESESLTSTSQVVEEQRVAEPEPVFGVLEQMLVDAAPTLAESEQVLAEPEPIPAEPELLLAAPQPILAEQEPTLAAPEPTLAEPAQMLAEPEPTLSEPEPMLVAPERELEESERRPADPEPTLSEPLQILAEPEKIPSRANVAFAPSASESLQLSYERSEIPNPSQDPLTAAATGRSLPQSAVPSPSKETPAWMKRATELSLAQPSSTEIPLPSNQSPLSQLGSRGPASVPEPSPPAPLPSSSPATPP